MRSGIALIAIVLVVGCDSTGLPVMDVDDMQLAIVSGDGQVGSVAEANTSALIAPLSADVELSERLADTLIARIEDKSGAGGTLPPNTIVNYVVPTEGCGSPWGGTALPNDSGTVRELWMRPAGRLPNVGWHVVEGDSVWGALCEMEARTVVDNTFATDTVFRAVFTHGPIDPMYKDGPAFVRSSQPRTIPAGSSFAEDVYGNGVPGTCPVFEPTDTLASTETDVWPGCRTLSWVDSDTVITAAGTLKVIDKGGVQVGHGVYEIRPIPTQEGAAIFFYTYGMSTACERCKK